MSCFKHCQNEATIKCLSFKSWVYMHKIEIQRLFLSEGANECNALKWVFLHFQQHFGCVYFSYLNLRKTEQMRRSISDVFHWEKNPLCSSKSQRYSQINKLTKMSKISDAQVCLGQRARGKNKG